MAKRFYQLAFDLGVQPRAFIHELANVGLSVGNQMVPVSEELEARVREVYAQLHPPVPAEPEAPPVVAQPESTDVAPDEGVAVVEEAAQATADVEAEPVPAGSETMQQDEGAEGGAAATDIDADADADADAKKAPSKDLVPTLDPRAGRLVKDTPKGGIAGVTTRARPAPGRAADGRGGGMAPTLRQPDRAPGARRESGRRAPDQFGGKRGKETFHMRKRGRRSKARPSQPKIRPTSIEVELPITVKRFCELSTYKAAEVIGVLFRNHKIIVQPNSTLDRDTVEILAIEMDIDVTFVEKDTAEDVLLKEFEVQDDAKDLKPRAPVVTILGHVDHGKTTLLDKIRSTEVAAREAGGITQHIAASQITRPDGRKITFIDTPGHEAFTEMRARGAQVTDVVILIVAADDGVMPQTIEAISHTKAAGVDMVVAITKCDKDNAQPERVKQQLSEHEVYVEGYGGDVSVFEVSGITGQGVDELLDHLALMSEVDAEKFRANPNRTAQGTVVEAENSPKRGVLTTVLVQNGTLKKGDAVLAGEAWGTVRQIFDDRGNVVKAAGPSTPVELIGLDKAPEAGSKLYTVARPAQAKVIADARRITSRERERAAQSKPTTVESLLGAIDQGKVDEMNVVVKADVRGSLQPLKTVLERLSNDEIRVRILHAGVGAVNESDVVLASASSAFVIGFNVNVDAKARAKAKMLGVDMRTYKVIYDIEQDVRDLMEGRLAPEMFEVVLGHAEVLQIFTFSKIGNIAGCRVKDGMLRKDGLVRVHRGGELIHEGQLSSLRREKDEVKEVKEGFECGLTISGWDEFEIGDMVEVYVIQAKKRTLGAARTGA